MATNRNIERVGSEWRHYFEQYKLKMEVPNPPSLYFDAYPMSAKRPEAHHSPPVDCLHWCEVGVPDHWTKVSLVYRIGCGSAGLLMPVCSSCGT